jgi:hypothetical protein
VVRDRIDAKLAELHATRRNLVAVIESCKACNCRIHPPSG